jgi:hypothetical protein
MQMKANVKFIVGFILGILTLPLINDAFEIYSNKIEHQYRDKYCALAGKTRYNCTFEIWYNPFVEQNKKLEDITRMFIDVHTPLENILTHRCNHAIFVNPNVPEDSEKMTNRQYFDCSAIQNALNNIIFWEWK